MNQPPLVQGFERCDHSLRNRSDLSRRRRSDREKAAEARAWIESANHCYGFVVDGNTDHLHQGVVFAASAPHDAAHQPQLRFVAFARHSLCHADLRPRYAGEPCIAVTATAKAPEPLDLIDADLVLRNTPCCHRAARCECEMRLERILISGRVAR